MGDICVALLEIEKGIKFNTENLTTILTFIEVKKKV